MHTPGNTESEQRRRLIRVQSRGLIWLAFLVLALSVLRAGVRHVFPHGWWHLW